MKLDINTLRKAVNQKLVSEQFVAFAEPVEVHQGSHSSFGHYRGTYRNLEAYNRR